MRAMPALVLLLVIGCNLPSTSTQSPTPRQLANGGVVDFQLPNPAPAGAGCVGCGTANPSGMAAAPDGTVWYFDVGQQTLARVTARGEITQFKVPGTGDGSRAITVAADGNVWMVARSLGGPDWILRVTPSGTVTKFAAGTGLQYNTGTSPDGITIGPDHNIWFTEVSTSRIARMTPDGTLTEFAIPVPNSSPRGIVAGPDGNVWFTESSRDRVAIGQVKPTGEMIDFPITIYKPDLNPTSIIAGPDGNLWFTAVGEVDRITVHGVVTRFGVAGHGSPGGLTLGPDGNIWFTDPDANAVGRVTAAGKVSEYPMPRRYSQPLGIAAGPDGRIWFTEAGVGRVGSMGVTVPQVRLSTTVLDFADVAQAETVRNLGDGPLRITSARIAGPDQASFHITGDTCSGHTLGIGFDCRVDLAYAPGAQAGVQAARLELSDNATGTPQVVWLLGRLPACKLPVVVATPSGTAVSAGFLGTASQAFTQDQGAGASPTTFAHGRWFPASSYAVSPDGSRYAYSKEFKLHVVDAATGNDRTLDLPQLPYGVLAFAPEGIYVHLAYEGIGPGLSLVDPDTGAVRQLLTDVTVLAVADGAAWIGAVNSLDPHPPQSGMGGMVPNEVLRRDLVTGQTVTWLYRPGESLWVGTTSGTKLLVYGYPNGGSQPAYSMLSSPNQDEALVSPVTGDALPLTGSMVADSNGVWLGSADGIYFWSARTGPALVSDLAYAFPAGTCA